MRSKAQVIAVNTETPFSPDNGKTKLYKTQFVDVDGFVGSFYSNKLMKFGDDITVELVENGGKYKFKCVKS